MQVSFGVNLVAGFDYFTGLVDNILQALNLTLYPKDKG